MRRGRGRVLGGVTAGLAIAGWLLPVAAGATCYQLFSQADAKIYEGSIPHFDISYPGNSAAYSASRARGEYLMIVPSNVCAPVYADEGTASGAGHYRGRSSGGGLNRGSGGGRGGGIPCSGSLGGIVRCLPDGHWQCANGISDNVVPCN